MTVEPITVWAPSSRDPKRSHVIADAFDRAWSGQPDPIRFLHELTAGFCRAWDAVWDPRRYLTSDGQNVTVHDWPQYPLLRGFLDPPQEVSASLPSSIRPDDAAWVFVNALHGHRGFDQADLAAAGTARPNRDEVIAAIRDGWPTSRPGDRLGQRTHHAIRPWITQDVPDGSAYMAMREIEDDMVLALLNVLADGHAGQPVNAGAVLLASQPSLDGYGWTREQDGRATLLHEVPPEVLAVMYA